MRRLLAGLCAIGVFVGCRSADGDEHIPLARDALRADAIGCYWLYTDSGRVDGTYLHASPAVRLDSTLAAPEPTLDYPGSYRLLVRLDSLGQRLDPEDWIGYTWAADSLGDTIRLSFSNGYSGALAALHASSASADTLKGEIREHWDFGPPFVTSHTSVRAVRSRCG